MNELIFNLEEILKKQENHFDSRKTLPDKNIDGLTV